MIIIIIIYNVITVWLLFINTYNCHTISIIFITDFLFYRSRITELLWVLLLRSCYFYHRQPLSSTAAVLVPLLMSNTTSIIMLTMMINLPIQIIVLENGHFCQCIHTTSIFTPTLFDHFWWKDHQLHLDTLQPVICC